ncbi:MAG: TolC family protein [Gemmatimonadaceae bacterium]
MRAQNVVSVDTLKLTLGEARALALRSNPGLRSARLDTAIAAGELVQASVILRNNPTIDVLTGGAGIEIGLGQEIEIAGQRSARRSAAMAGLQRARAGVFDTTRLTLASVDRVFFRLAAANRRVNLAEKGRALSERLAEATTRQLEAGKISRLEANLAIVEVGRSRARTLSTRREREQTASALRQLLGLSARQPIATVVEPNLFTKSNPAPSSPSVATFASDSMNLDSLTSIALARRPDLDEVAAAARQARGLAAIARKEALPNLALRASSEPGDKGGRILRPGVGISLPVFNSNRGEIQARLAEARQGELRRVALTDAIRIEVATALSSYQSARSETQVFEQIVLQPARENSQLLEIAYSAGKVGLPVLLLIRNQVIDAELEYMDAWLAEREALTDLSAATGEVLGAARALQAGKAR